MGAMGRADSVVVVGDCKQMPPTSFGETALDADDEVELEAVVVQDEESILSECVQAQEPSKWLSWHYRSQDESLISFSNYHYYESRLSSFPAPLRSAELESRDGYGFTMARVNGTFNRSGRGKELRTNRIKAEAEAEAEAEAIVAEIRRRFEAASAAQADALPTDFLRDTGANSGERASRTSVHRRRPSRARRRWMPRRGGWSAHHTFSRLSGTLKSSLHT
ncbi:superfamily I DNA and/or RNA helicase [Herbiconiux flava]|uniref:Superfamily I DNA and/or RNA helicase n=2 Tax=Herbiconiux flava TaxID=881268 RepID=A0A852SQD9_9MICO|nr:superfamily I DNA and/or RNA helicase [Herbiconiux flava]